LAQLYTKTGKFEQAAERLGFLHKAAQAAEEKESILAGLLNVYLRWPNVKNAAGLVANRLLEKDLDPNDVIVRSIDSYFTKPFAGTDPKAVLEALTRIKTQDRPNWLKQVKSWTARLNPPPKEPEKPKEPPKPKETDKPKEIDKPKEPEKPKEADKPK
jgi:outer membrane biosynthesis protein TonB